MQPVKCCNEIKAKPESMPRDHPSSLDPVESASAVGDRESGLGFTVIIVQADSLTQSFIRFAHTSKLKFHLQVVIHHSQGY